jgi:hypothetical protein
MGVVYGLIDGQNNHDVILIETGHPEYRGMQVSVRCPDLVDIITVTVQQVFTTYLIYWDDTIYGAAIQ